MICETCHGRSWIAKRRSRDSVLIAVEDTEPCPNPLCHNGHVACCDGLQEQPTLCSDCPPVGHSTDKTRCDDCPRLVAQEQRGASDDQG